MTDDNKKGLIEGLAMHPLHVSVIEKEIIFLSDPFLLQIE